MIERLEDKLPLQDEDGNPVYVKPDALQPGDVLLVYTDPEPFSISWWVRKLDGGWFSHAAFFDGTQIIEAYKDGGIKATPVHVRVQASHYVDVYRFRSDNHHELGSPGWPSDPVVEATRGYLGSGFGMNDLIYGAVVAVTRFIDLPGDLEAPLRGFLDRAMKALQDLASPEETEHLTCSELVYRGFYDAEPGHRYRLRIDTTHEGAGVLGPEPWVLRPGADEAAPGLEPETMKALQDFAEAYVAHKARFRDRVPPDAAVGIADRKWIGQRAVASYVGPRDLDRSPNLRDQGRARKEDFTAP